MLVPGLDLSSLLLCFFFLVKREQEKARPKANRALRELVRTGSGICGVVMGGGKKSAVRRGTNANAMQ